MSDYETPIPIPPPPPPVYIEAPRQVRPEQPKPGSSKRPCKECGQLVGNGYARCKKCRQLGKAGGSSGKRKESGVVEDERQAKRSRKGSEVEVAEELLEASSPVLTPATSSPPPETDNDHDMRTSSPGPQPQDTAQHKSQATTCRICQVRFRAYGGAVDCSLCCPKESQPDVICQDCSTPFKGSYYVRCAVCRQKRREEKERVNIPPTEMEYQTLPLLLQSLKSVESASKKAVRRSGPKGRVRLNGSYTIVKDPGVSNIERAKLVAKELRSGGGIMFDYESPLFTSTPGKDKVMFRCLCGSSKPKPTLPAAQGEKTESGRECRGTVQITVSNDDSHPLGIEGQRVEVRVWHGKEL